MKGGQPHCTLEGSQHWAAGTPVVTGGTLVTTQHGRRSLIKKLMSVRCWLLSPSRRQGSLDTGLDQPEGHHPSCCSLSSLDMTKPGSLSLSGDSSSSAFYWPRPARYSGTSVCHFPRPAKDLNDLPGATGPFWPLQMDRQVQTPKMWQAKDVISSCFRMGRGQGQRDSPYCLVLSGTSLSTWLWDSVYKRLQFVSRSASYVVDAQ